MNKLKHFIAVIFILSGIGSFSKNNLIAGFLLISLGVLFVPIVSKKLSTKLQVWKNKKFRYVTYITIFIVACGVVGKPKKENLTSNKQLIKKEISKDNIDNKAVFEDSKLSQASLVKSPADSDHSEFWNKFDPIVKERVYKMIEEKDCEGLQIEFNTTADNMENLQRNGKSGSRNLELMSFLEEQMKNLKCY